MPVMIVHKGEWKKWSPATKRAMRQMALAVAKRFNPSGMPRRIQLSRRKGFRLQEVSKALNGLEARRVTRPGKWGNPFYVEPGSKKVLACASNEHAVECFRELVVNGKMAKELQAQIKRDLKGFNLACFCPLNKPCHADVLLEIANA